MTRGTPRAVILLSGGLDSATALAIARHEGFACHALSFDYGQRHRVELDAAKRVANSMGVVEHRIITIDPRALGGSALTDDDIDVPKMLTPSLEGGGQGVGGAPDSRAARTGTGRAGVPPAVDGDIPVTYVPARNTIFLSFALAHAEVIGARDIFIGVNAIDYSGYPDCRPAFIEQFENLANLATRIGVESTADEQRIRIHAPLIDMTKAQIIRRGADLGVDYGLTVSCYDPDVGGRPCGACDSCVLRAAGFNEAGLVDPAAIRG